MITFFLILSVFDSFSPVNKSSPVEASPILLRLPTTGTKSKADDAMSFIK